MKTTRRQKFIAAAFVGALVFITTVAWAADPLPSKGDAVAPCTSARLADYR